MIYIFNITEDKEDRIIRIDVTAENWKENKLLAKGMGLKIFHLKLSKKHMIETIGRFS